MKIRLAAFAAIALTMSFAGAAHAGPQFVDKTGIANFGFDVVAYHTTFAAAKGAPTFTATHNGATFWFASAANRDLFRANPAAYAPAYDGHCAFALTRHKKLTVDPEAFSIVDPKSGKLVDRATYKPGTGVLYLNYDPGVNKQFNKDLTVNISKADYAWKDCLEPLAAAKPTKGVSDLFDGKRPATCKK
jgi:YHS domain-containing protein